MKREHLLDAVGHIDDDLILEADEKPAGRKLPLWRIATALAAAVALCGGLYLLPALQSAETAAPEHIGADDMLTDVADVADGGYAYVTDGDYTNRDAGNNVKFESQTSATGTAGETTGGVFEPVFCTEQGRYMLEGEEFPLKSKLPDDARYLGELVKTDHDKPSYPSVGTQELVGRKVWQSTDGEYLYIQDPAGGWLQATRAK